MQYTPFALPMLLSVPIHLGLAFYAWWRARDAEGALPFAFAMLLAAVWSLDYALEVTSTTVESKVFWMSIRFPVIEVLVVALFVMAAQYTGRTRLLKRRWLLSLFVVPAIVSVLALTTTQHALFRYDFRLDTAGAFPTLLFRNGAGYVLHGIYGYTLVVASVILVAWPVRGHRRLHYQGNSS